MILIYCSECRDAFVIRQYKVRNCACGRTAGTVLKDNTGMYCGNTASAIALNENSLKWAFKLQETDGGPMIDAAVPPPDSDKIRKVSPKEFIRGRALDKSPLPSKLIKDPGN